MSFYFKYRHEWNWEMLSLYPKKCLRLFTKLKLWTSMLLTIPLVGYLSQNKASGPITGLCYPMFLTVTNWRGNSHCQTAGRRGFESSTRGDVHSKKHYVIWHNIKLRATENKLSKKTESFYCTLVPFSFWWIAPNCVLGDRSAVTFTLSTVYSTVGGR